MPTRTKTIDLSDQQILQINLWHYDQQNQHFFLNQSYQQIDKTIQSVTNLRTNNLTPQEDDYKYQVFIQYLLSLLPLITRERNIQFDYLTKQIKWIRSMDSLLESFIWIFWVFVMAGLVVLFFLFLVEQQTYLFGDLAYWGFCGSAATYFLYQHLKNKNTAKKDKCQSMIQKLLKKMRFQ